MSSIMRWRSGLIVLVVIGNSCLEVDETSILKTGDRARYNDLSPGENVRGSGTVQQAIAQAI